MLDAFAGSFWPGATYALRVSPSPVELVRWDPSGCSAKASPGSTKCVPFADQGEGALLISAGYVATTALLAPLGTMTLEENMLQQKISFVALIGLSGQFVWTFACSGLSVGLPPWIGNHWADALGVVIFNFAFCVTVPSWLNEKAPRVSVNQVFWASTISSTLLYTLVGVLGAMAFPHVPENMLTLLLSHQVGVPTRVCATVFGVVIIGFGVPIFCVLMRYNLVNGGLCTEPWAHVWANVLPWGTAWMLYQGSAMLQLLSWSGLFLNGFIDFLMPALVTLVSLGLARRLLRAVRWCRRRRRRGGDAAGAGAPVGEALDEEDEAAVAPPKTPVRPFPSWLQPIYFEIVASMVAFLLVLLPAAIWLQLYCAGSDVCYPSPDRR